MSSVEIIPAPLPKSLADLEEHLERVKGLAEWVQIDVADGIFVPNTTWPYTDRADFETILAEKEGLPFWEEFDFEVDLMVTHALQDAKEWVQAGAARIIVHIESEDASLALEALQPMRAVGGAPGVEVAVALSLDTPTQKLESFIPLADSIQVMSIARIGFQGEPFDERAIARVRQLKEMYPDHAIGVDGGVSLENARALVDAGASRLAVGSALFEADDSAEMYRALQALVRG